MAKRDITMTQAEIDEFLGRCPFMVVGALAADGWPVGTIAASSVVDGRVSLGFADGDAVRRELDRDPQLCCVADEHESYFEIKGVMLHGTLAADGHTVHVGHVLSFDFGRLR